jgi:hypothetical protein
VHHIGFSTCIFRDAWSKNIILADALGLLDPDSEGTVVLRTVLYCIVLCYTVLYCTVLYCTVLYCTVLYSLGDTVTHPADMDLQIIFLSVLY